MPTNTAAKTLALIMVHAPALLTLPSRFSLVVQRLRFARIGFDAAHAHRPEDLRIIGLGQGRQRRGIMARRGSQEERPSPRDITCGEEVLAVFKEPVHLGWRKADRTR